MSSPVFTKISGKPARGGTSLMQLAGELPSRFTAGLKVVMSFFTGKKAAALRVRSTTQPKLPPLSEEEERLIIRKMPFALYGDYMGALVIEGLMRNDRMSSEELAERKRQWEAKRAALLSAVHALQQAPENPPTWAQKVVEQFQKDLKGE